MFTLTSFSSPSRSATMRSRTAWRGGGARSTVHGTRGGGMRACTRCGAEVETAFRFCPWCAAPQRLKVVEFFRGHPVTERDRGKALRVSRYLGPPERHVRFSVWSD